jgi:F0F1-type ATP synthase membrane subunit a
MFISYLVYWYFEVFIFGYGARSNLDRVEKELQAQIDLIVDLVRPEGSASHE